MKLKNKTLKIETSGYLKQILLEAVLENLQGIHVM